MSKIFITTVWQTPPPTYLPPIISDQKNVKNVSFSLSIYLPLEMSIPITEPVDPHAPAAIKESTPKPDPTSKTFAP